MNKLEIAIQELGISTRDNNNEIRPFIDIIDDISIKWDEVEERDREILAKKIATNPKLLTINEWDESMEEYKYCKSIAEKDLLESLSRGLANIEGEYIEVANSLAQKVHQRSFSYEQYRELKALFLNDKANPIDNYISNMVINMIELIDEFMLELSLNEIAENRLKE